MPMPVKIKRKGPWQGDVHADADNVAAAAAAAADAAAPAAADDDDDNDNGGEDDNKDRLAVRSCGDQGLGQHV